MKIEELRAAKSQVPFEPFLIRTSDGRELRIGHPDAVAWDSEKSPRSLLCVSPEGWSVLDLAHVTSLAAAPKAEAGPKARRKG
ncbi:MAG: hypothetical protein BGO49_25300 [Planctomycetales bacterium 71-10]|mgnify:FL=1|nr:MAG: hypothetical protein BGO49_25300 [Planctomycetales bacterium 71-10]